MKNKIIIICVSLCLIISLAYSFYLSEENSLLLKQIANRNQEIKEEKKLRLTQASLFNAKIDSLAIINDNFTLSGNGGNVSISSIVNSANKWFNEKEDLKYKLLECNLNLKQYKTFYGKEFQRANENAEIANRQSKRGNDVSSQFKDVLTKYNPDKYVQFELFYKAIRDRYGIDYIVEKKADSNRIFYLKGADRIDTALNVYKQFKPNILMNGKKLK